MFVFTRSLTAAVIVVVAVSNIVVYVTAMMSAFFKWNMGPVEVVSIIVFLGYCVTSLRNAVIKGGSEESCSRVQVSC